MVVLVYRHLDFDFVPKPSGDLRGKSENAKGRRGRREEGGLELVEPFGA